MAGPSHRAHRAPAYARTHTPCRVQLPRCCHALHGAARRAAGRPDAGEPACVLGLHAPHRHPCASPEARACFAKHHSPVDAAASPIPGTSKTAAAARLRAPGAPVASFGTFWHLPARHMTPAAPAHHIATVPAARPARGPPRPRVRRGPAPPRRRVRAILRPSRRSPAPAAAPRYTRVDPSMR